MLANPAKRRRRLLLPLLSLLAVPSGFTVARVEAQVEVVSVTSNGTLGNASSLGPATSADGRCVAFYSEATNFPPLFPPFDVKHVDVYVYDRAQHTLQRVTVNDALVEANGTSQAEGVPVSIDDDCTCVVFSSQATNLVAGDTNHLRDVFVRQLSSEPFTERISVGDDFVEANGLSQFGRASGDCDRVAFQSTATNLVPDDSNGRSDIFVRERENGVTMRVNLGPGGVQANADSTQPAISNDGHCVAFVSAATNLLPGDTRGKRQVYVSCNGEVTCRASANSNGTPANGDSFLPALSADGRLVAFVSEANNIAAGNNNPNDDVYLHDCSTGFTERLSFSATGDNSNFKSSAPNISGDGRFVAFASFATNLVGGVPPSQLNHEEVYVRDRFAHVTTIASQRPDGTPGNDAVADMAPSVSRNGQFVAFGSLATNLIPTRNDNNFSFDAFIAPIPLTPLPTHSVSPTNTPTSTPTPTPTNTGAPTSSRTPTRTFTATPSSTPTRTPTPTSTPTPTNTRVPTNTRTATPTATPSRTPTPTSPPMLTPTVLDTPAPTSTPTPTPTALPRCTGDCNGSLSVSLLEMIRCLRIVNHNCDLADCPRCDPDGDGADLTDFLNALQNASDGGCR